MSNVTPNSMIPFKSILWPKPSLTLLLFQGANGCKTPNNLDTRGTKKTHQIIPRRIENTTTRISFTNMHGILAPIDSSELTLSN